MHSSFRLFCVSSLSGCFVYLSLCVSFVSLLSLWLLYASSLCGCFDSLLSLSALSLFSLWLLCASSLCGCFVHILSVAALCIFSLWLLCAYSLCGCFVSLLSLSALSLFSLWLLCAFSLSVSFISQAALALFSLWLLCASLSGCLILSSLYDCFVSLLSLAGYSSFFPLVQATHSITQLPLSYLSHCIYLLSLSAAHF